ncbi:MAG TPA: hypothetical protein VEO54_09765 [Thermoanaerobaculia bacterium]|nr:hypothetical protein [Thermoanaerobaculia bacterium]
MRGVFFRTTAVWLLLAILLAPSAFASEATADTSLWVEFVTWLESRLVVPGGVAIAIEVDFTVWLMSRLGVPGG